MELKGLDLGSGSEPKKLEHRNEAVKNTMDVYNKVLLVVAEEYLKDKNVDEEDISFLYDMVKLANQLEFGRIEKEKEE